MKRVLYLHPDSEGYEEGEYYGGFSETLILKEEYQTKLSEDESSVMTFTFEAPRGMYYATLSGDNLEIGDEINVNNCDLSKHYQWDALLLESWQEQMNVLLTDTITITNNRLNLVGFTRKNTAQINNWFLAHGKAAGLAEKEDLL